jgi:hypothetical protein
VAVGKKRQRDETPSKYHEKEEEVNDIYEELKEKHSDKYDIPNLRLWARMIASNQHRSMEYPPSNPLFRSVPKRSRQDPLSASIAIAQCEE